MSPHLPSFIRAFSVEFTGFRVYHLKGNRIFFALIFFKRLHRFNLVFALIDSLGFNGPEPDFVLCRFFLDSLCLIDLAGSVTGLRV